MSDVEWPEFVRYESRADLPEELRRYCDSTHGLERICHPLFVQPFPAFTNGTIEDCIAHNEMMLIERIEQDRFFSALILIERPWRPYYLYRWEQTRLLGTGRRADIRYWKLVNHAWADAEYPSRAPEWPGILASKRNYSEAIMSRADRYALAGMGPVITAYRGLSAKAKSTAGRFVRSGYSWTLSRERAEWFARRFECLGKPFVATAQIPREAVLAYLTDRKEDEILIRPRSVEPESLESIEP